jgi:hypothetical protein
MLDCFALARNDGRKESVVKFSHMQQKAVGICQLLFAIFILD